MIRQFERDLDRILDEHGTSLHDESGIGPVAAATLLVEVGDPFRFTRESFARWCGTGAVALSSGEGAPLPVKHRLGYVGNRRINSVLFVASVVQHRDIEDARVYTDKTLVRARHDAKHPRAQATPRQPRRD